MKPCRYSKYISLPKWVPFRPFHSKLLVSLRRWTFLPLSHSVPVLCYNSLPFPKILAYLLETFKEIERWRFNCFYEFISRFWIVLARRINSDSWSNCVKRSNISAIVQRTRVISLLWSGQSCPLGQSSPSSCSLRQLTSSITVLFAWLNR